MHKPYKTFYSFDPDTGIYNGESQAYLDTLASTSKTAVYILPSNVAEQPPPGEAPTYQAWFMDSGQWVLRSDYSRAEVWRIVDGQPGNPPPAGKPLPADLTIQRPPEHSSKQVRRWVESSGVWEVVADHRGEIWYSVSTGLPERVETIDLPDGLTDTPRPEAPSPHHVWKNGKWILTADGKAEALRAKRVALLADIAAKRYAVETGGLTFADGMCVGTDRQDQATITGAVSATQLGQVSFDWKGADGTWIALTAKQIMQIGAAVAAHVQACFSAEKQHCEAVEKLKDAKLDGYNIDAGWPSNTIGG